MIRNKGYGRVSLFLRSGYFKLEVINILNDCLRQHGIIITRFAQTKDDINIVQGNIFNTFYIKS